jgi:hypothetical protein
MTLKVRVQKAPGDPLNRFLVPLCIDKAFFCTSRVAPMVEWMIAKNLHWEVTAGAGGDPSRDGGKQRLIARVLVCRKSYYCKCLHVSCYWVCVCMLTAFLFFVCIEICVKMLLSSCLIISSYTPSLPTSYRYTSLRNHGLQYQHHFIHCLYSGYRSNFHRAAH